MASNCLPSLCKLLEMMPLLKTVITWPSLQRLVSASDACG